MSRKLVLVTAGATLSLLLCLLGVAAFVFSGKPAAAPSVAAAARFRGVTSYDVAETVLDGKLKSGWEDWGWGPHDAHGDQGIRVNFSGYGGIVLRHAPVAASYGALVFRYRATGTFGLFLDVALQNAQLPPGSLPTVKIAERHVAELPGGIREVMIPWSELDPGHQAFDRVLLKANRMVPPDPVSLDHVVFVGRAVTEAELAPARRTRLAVRCDKPAHTISPLIYGIAAGDGTTGETAHRAGGNAMSRFNWDIKAWNAAADWFFENIPSTTGMDDWAKEAFDLKATMAVVVPMLGWVAKDSVSSGFPVSKFGPQRKRDPDRDAGDGARPDGTPIAPGSPTQTSVEAPPELVGRWVSALRASDRARGGHTVNVYMLDNEPSLWNSTHRDVHPEPVTYDELLDRTIRYGSAVRAADPDAIIAGPSEWGWTGYFFSAKDTRAGWMLQPDRRAHGGVALLPWYLQRLAEHEKQTGTKLLDWVDVHFYPQAPNVYGGDRTDPETSALRLRSTRALWDPDYLDESWIKEHVNLIPRLRAWISENYPGRGICIGEWSFGAEDHISGGLAIAEALGRFGQQGIDAAYYWRSLKADTAGHDCFRAFRNFDGQGGRFLDWSVPTEEANDVSLFASRDEQGTHFVLVLLNLDAEYAADAHIDMSSCGKIASQRLFTYDGHSKKLSAGPEPGMAPGDPSELSELLPPYSLAVVDLKLAPKP
jgi:hypothetical protein